MIKMKTVIDASVILARLMPDEKLAGRVDKLYQRFEKGKLDLMAPNLLVYEIANSIKSACVQKRLTRKTGQALLEAFLDLPIRYVGVDWLLAWNLSMKFGLSFYDAVYLSLANELGVELITLDKKLMRVYNKLC